MKTNVEWLDEFADAYTKGLLPDENWDHMQHVMSGATFVMYHFGNSPAFAANVVLVAFRNMRKNRGV